MAEPLGQWFLACIFYKKNGIMTHWYISVKIYLWVTAPLRVTYQDTQHIRYIYITIHNKNSYEAAIK